MDMQALEIKRARNMIWNAAGDYSFEPSFIGLKADGSADEYLNMIHGLVHKWLDFSVIDELFASLGGSDRELYEGLLWIGLEHAVYEKEKDSRPALSQMRLSYAQENLFYQAKVSVEERIDLLYHGYFEMIVGLPCSLPPRDLQLLKDFCFPGDLTALQIAERTKELLYIYFSFRPNARRAAVSKPPKRRRSYIGSKARVRSGFISLSLREGQKEKPHFLQRFHMWRRYFFSVSAPVMENDTKAYVEACFGRSMYSEWETARLDRALCTQNHQGLHLHFTCGNPSAPSGSEHTIRQIRLYCNQAAAARQQNLETYQANSALCQNAITRLKCRIRNAMDAAQPVSNSRSRFGSINAGQVWKALYDHDDRVFTKQLAEPSNSFCVDLLLDGSSSRDNCQATIATQAFILSQSLTQCHIPVQISSFVTIRDYTVLRRFRGYEQSDQNEAVFEYVAGGNNRDGLALRGISHLMDAQPEKRHILILLTDACPYDDFPGREGRFRKREYKGEEAVSDTAHEVLLLREQGITVLGVFMGTERSTADARRIFGKDFVKIKDLSQFADAVGTMLETYLAANVPG